MTHLLPETFCHLLVVLISHFIGIQRYNFFQNRSDTGNSEDRPIPIQSDTVQFLFIYIFLFLCNLEFLYFSVLTRSSLFCVLNTIYYSVSQLVGQKCWVCSPKVGCETVLRGSQIVYSQRNDINKKNVILNAFLMRDFYFKRRAGNLLTLSDHLTQMQFK